MRHHALTLIKVLLLTCLLSFAVAAQSTSATDGSTPLGLQPGTPAGSYALSGFDNVNLYNGNLSFQLSLLGVAGRGGAQAYSGNAVTVTDQAGKLRRSLTDGLGRLIRVDEPNGSNSLGDVSSPQQPTAYTYDVLDNLTGVSQGGQTRTFVYNSLKRLTSATNPESGTVTYDYDANGNLITKVDANSITTSFAYDAINRVTSRSYLNSPGTPAISYCYDAQPLPSGAPTFDRGYSTGRLVAVTYGSGSSAGTYRGYDQMGRVVRQYQRTDSVNYLVEATYYANSSPQTLTYPAVPGAGDRRVVTYTNDAAGRLSALSSTATSYGPGASVSSIQYAAHNSLKTETYGNGLIHAVTYNERLQATEIKLGTSGNPTSIVALGYGYGTTSNNGNVLTHSYNGGGLSYTQTFGYDSLNRLTTSSESGSSWSQTNAYDRYGNRWIDLGGGSQSLYFNTANNRITGSSYDAAGNLLNDGSHSYSYDAENKITNVDSVPAFIYDGEGQRVRKLVGENLRFVYSIGGQLLAEFSGVGGPLRKEYIYGAQGLLATIEPTAVNPNGTRYTTADNLGSPRVVTNSTASLVSRHDYMPFGEELSAGVGGRTTVMGFPGSSDGLRQKFTAKERDVETGLDFFEARYFSSVQGRFTSVDPGSFVPADPQSWNRYLYTQNNPLKFTDPTGEDLYFTGDYADVIVADLERFSGLKLLRDPTTGKVTIDKSQKRKTKGTSYSLAAALGKAIGNEKVTVAIKTMSESKDNQAVAIDSFARQKLDVDDIQAIKRDAPDLAAGLLTHVITEYYEAQLLPVPMSLEAIFLTAHSAALEAESDTVGDLNGSWWQQPRSERTTSGHFAAPPETVRFKYSTIEYDIVFKSGADGHATQVDKVTKIDKTPKSNKK